VVGTLWSVDDRLTPAVVTAFHRRWASGQSAAAALRGAQLELMESDDPRQRHPYVWGAFQLIGNTD
jgi:CHAT domain-containing protein